MIRSGWQNRISALFAGLALCAAASCQSHNPATLTPQERAWLQAHPVIRWAPDTGYPPIEWVEPGGTVKGLAPDYLTLLGKKLGVRFEPVICADWKASLAALQGGKVDLLSNLTELPERRDQMLFTQSYLDVPSILLTRVDDGVKGLEDLGHRRMALERSYVVVDMLRKAHPTIDIVEVDSAEDALQQLALGAVDGTIADLAQASWTIQHRQLTGIRMVRRLPEYPSQFAMAVRRDQPLLRDILDKGLQGISANEHQELHRRWISLQVLGWHPTAAFWGLLGGGIGLAALLLVLLWNQTLRNRVRSRTLELERTTQALVAINAELVQTITEVKTLRGFIPICMRCKKIRNDEGYWGQLEAYLSAHSEARFSHGYCPECIPIAQAEMRRELGMPPG